MTIDWWTLGLQAVNVLILIWLLARFFWRPVSGMIAERRAAIAGAIADADAKRAAADAALAEIERVRAGFAQERDAILAQARAGAEELRAAHLAETRKQAAEMERAAQDAILKDREAAENAWAERAGQLAIDIAGRLLARLKGPAVLDAFLAWLVDEIRNLPEGVRATMADGAGLQVVTATPLDAAQQERCRKLIGDVLGTEPPMAFVTDVDLIAGLELRGTHLVIRNSWRADLERIRTELDHAGRQ